MSSTGSPVAALAPIGAAFREAAGVTLGPITATILRWPDGTARGVHHDSPAGLLARAAQSIARSTGFSEPGVVLWILTGAEPHLQRALVTVTDYANWLGSSQTPYARRSVTLTLNARIQEADFRRLFRQVRAAFDQGPDFQPTRGRRGPVINAFDAHLQRIVDTFPDATWEERAEQWQARGGERATADALRIRWLRYQRKLKAMERPVARSEPSKQRGANRGAKTH